MNKHKVKLSIRQHNKLFKCRQIKILTRYEIIDDPQKRDIEMYQYIRFPVRILAIVLSPFAILVGGVPAMIRVIRECLSNENVGVDTINREWFYRELGGNNANS